MDSSKVYEMKFVKIYPALIAKAERKNRSKEEVFTITSWLTGYKREDLETFLSSDLSYGEFLMKAPDYNPNAELIKGSICGVKVELIEDPFMKRVRQLDKLVDELAKGKSMEKILRK